MNPKKMICSVIGLAVLTISLPAMAADGEAVYKQACLACHGAGVAGAPKAGDATAWASRISQGTETLYLHAINGFKGTGGIMPPKGGQSSLSDDDVKAAVDYMVKAAK